MKFYFQASHAEVAQEAFQVLSKRYGQQLSPAEADVIVPIGGDGEALKALQLAIEFKKPVYGINLGHVGFLQNIYRKNKNLEKSIRAAEATELSPLRVEAYLLDGSVKKAFAVNEVQICNHNRASIINLHVDINEKEHIKKLGGDGLIISTTVGSTGYNKAAGGTMLPLGDDIIALTPNNPFNPPLKSETIRPGHILVKVLDPHLSCGGCSCRLFRSWIRS